MANTNENKRVINHSKTIFLHVIKSEFEKPDGTGTFPSIKARLDGKKVNVGLKINGEDISNIPNGLHYIECAECQASDSSFFPKIYISFTGNYFSKKELTTEQLERLVTTWEDVNALEEDFGYED